MFLEKKICRRCALFLGGVLFGTAGFGILSSRDARKLYTEGTAAVLRARECVMNKVTGIREAADDILEDAKEINEARAAEEEACVLEDTSEENA